ncbi:MAG: hypothetical protein H6767_02075 [Candidatus Peribacteria bacterium]|nr:MAG: hypothetical protein H6767_02075 [Candidatus Peribacteria bacterium]
MYAPNTDLIVYDKEYWNSDACDVTKYALEIDTEKSFFEQYEKLLHTTPLPSLTVTYESENSEYAIYSGKMKECYMLFASW